MTFLRSLVMTSPDGVPSSVIDHLEQKVKSCHRVISTDFITYPNPIGSGLSISTVDVARMFALNDLAKRPFKMVLLSSPEAIIKKSTGSFYYVHGCAMPISIKF